MNFRYAMLNTQAPLPRTVGFHPTTVIPPSPHSLHTHTLTHTHTHNTEAPTQPPHATIPLSDNTLYFSSSQTFGNDFWFRNLNSKVCVELQPVL